MFSSIETENITWIISVSLDCNVYIALRSRLQCRVSAVAFSHSLRFTSAKVAFFLAILFYGSTRPKDSFFRLHSFSPSIADEFRSKIACENDVIQLICNPYSRIAIYSASYGRTEYESLQCSQPQGVKEESKYQLQFVWFCASPMILSTL